MVRGPVYLLRVTTALAVFTGSAAASQDLGVERYGEACESGDGAACVTLGLIHESGPGTVRDPSAAAFAYERACDLGVPRGCTNFGLLLEAGWGVNRDVERAGRLYATACADGEDLGCDRLRALQAAGLVAPSAASTTITTGRVVDGLTQSVLADAIVSVPALGIQALTDPPGRFELAGLPPGRHVVRAERFGYEMRELEVTVPGAPDLLILMTAADVAASDEPGRIVGRVTVNERGGSLSDVDVAVVGQGRARTLSNNQGRFTIRDVDPGLVTVRFERLGYASRTTHLVLQPGATVEVAATLATEAIELEPIQVTVINSWLERGGFYQRESRGFGSHFDRADLDALNLFDVSDVLWRVPGVRVRYDLNDAYAVGRGGCRLSIWVDGVPGWTSNLNDLPPEWVEAVEVYNGLSAPIQYRRDPRDPCGVILIWTRRGA